MKTLYVSDLDGILLRGDATVSVFTVNTLNAPAENRFLYVKYIKSGFTVIFTRVIRGRRSCRKIPRNPIRSAG